MESIARDITVIAGLTNTLYTLTVENLKPIVAAQLVIEPTWTAADLTAWFLANIGAGSADLGQDYEDITLELITEAMP